MAVKGIHTRPTGSNSVVFTGAVVGYRRLDGQVWPTHGNRTGWDDTSYSSFNEISYHGSKDISTDNGLGIMMDEGKKRYKTFEVGTESGLYPDSNMITGFEWRYLMDTIPLDTYHNNWIQRFGVVFENGNFWAADPLTKDGKNSAGTEKTVSSAYNNSGFQDAHRGTSIKYFRFNISTEGGAYRYQAQVQIRKFRFILKEGQHSSHRIVLPPNRPYAERNSRTKLTR